MITVKRYDRGAVHMDGATRTPQGFLKVPARITRTGVFKYRKADGSEFRELRVPDEVFDSAALESFALAPLTNEHPPEPLTPQNVSAYRVGTASETIRRDGEFVATTIVIENADAIKAVEQGKRELSCGYSCELEMTPGTTADGRRYDAIQRNIRGNHVALVAVGRAGPEARLRMDANDAEQIVADDAGTTDKEQHKMVKIKIDGVEYEVAPQVAQAIEKERAAGVEKLTATKADHDKQAARADAAEGKAKELQTKLDAAPTQIRAEIKARTELEAKAAKVLGADFKADGKTDAEIKLAVVAKVDPKLKLDDKSAAYIEARFDMAIDGAGSTSTERPVVVFGGNRRTDGAAPDEAAAREAMRVANRDAWKRADEQK